jgi:hypothetical protein
MGTAEAITDAMLKRMNESPYDLYSGRILTAALTPVSLRLLHES